VFFKVILVENVIFRLKMVVLKGDLTIFECPRSRVRFWRVVEVGMTFFGLLILFWSDAKDKTLIFPEKYACVTKLSIYLH